MSEMPRLQDRPGRREQHVVEELMGRVSPDTRVLRDEPLARRTTLRVGGPADVYVEPAGEADLAAVLQFCTAHQLPFFMLGRGSNLLVRDGGFRGVVICLAHPAFAQIEVQGECLRCGAGARLKQVAAEARRHGLSGLEFFDGIPGSVGGALRMNAGAMGSATFDVVRTVRVMDTQGVVHEWAAAEIEVSYRCCPMLKEHIALGAVFEGRPAPREEIERRMNEWNLKRWQSQPASASAGCIFKNPAGIPAGRLIEELGLKGARVGGAAVSMEHGNFIVNEGNARARDVLELIALIKYYARAQRGIELEPEVVIIGED
jgi:UDP-N-acetylenolpyruvoylglucosamine reductase